MNNYVELSDVEAAPAAQGGDAKLVAEWGDAYRAFTGAFDTPLACKRDDSEYANDARDRLRAIDAAISSATAQQPVAVDEAMVERACKYIFSDTTVSWPTQSKHNDDILRKHARGMLIAALGKATRDTA
jgi:hypothetical protein